MLDVLFETSADSESLMATRHATRVGGCDFEIPRFMLLGQRGGGEAIRVALFAGIEDHGSLDGVAAISRLLVEAAIQPALARDYAIFAYPLVNVFEYRRPVSPVEAFDRRFSGDRADGDVRFFRGELRKWRFNAILTLKTEPQAGSFRATVRSELLGEEVVRPALERVARMAPVNSRPIKVRPGDMRARLGDYSDGRLTPPPDLRPYPLEVEIFAPGGIAADLRIRGLFVAAHEILVNYRRVLAHATGI